MHNRRLFLQAAGRFAVTASALRLSGAATYAADAPGASTGPATNGAIRKRAADRSLFRWERLRPDAWVVFNGGGNVLVLNEGSRAIIVDTKVNGMGQLLRAEIEARVGPIAAVVLTHHHGDHSGGLPALTAPRTIAQAAGVPRIRARAERLAAAARDTPKELTTSLLDSLARDFEVPRSAAAERAIAADLARMTAADVETSVPAEQVTDRQELRIGTTTLELLHAGPGHTDNDLVICDRRRGIIHAGDLLFSKHHPFIDVSSGGTTQGWVSALGEVRRACQGETIVVAGHGPTGTRAALDEQAAYFERLRELVSRQRAAGRSRDEVVKLPNVLFPAYGFASEWTSSLGVMFDELEKRTSSGAGK